MKKKRLAGWLLLIVSSIAIAAVVLILIESAVSWLVGDTIITDKRETRVERFIKRCAPEWDEAVKALAAGSGMAERGKAMPEPVRRIFEKDRSLKYIDIYYDGSAILGFDWYIVGPETSACVYWQKDDDFRKIRSVAEALSWAERYNEPVRTEEKEDSLKLTGFGAGRKGYIMVRRLRPCWFITEEYYPT